MMRGNSVIPFYVNHEFLNPAAAVAASAALAVSPLGASALCPEDQAVTLNTWEEQEALDAALNDGLADVPDAYVAASPATLERTERPLTSGVTRLLAEDGGNGLGEDLTSEEASSAKAAPATTSADARLTTAILMKVALEVVGGKKFTQAESEKVVARLVEILSQVDDDNLAKPDVRADVIAQILPQIIKNLPKDLAAVLAEKIVAVMDLPLDEACLAVAEHAATILKEISEGGRTRYADILAMNPEIIEVPYDPATLLAELRLDDDVFLSVIRNPSDNDSDVKVTLLMNFGTSEEAGALFGKALDLIYNRHVITRGLHSVGDDIPVVGECTIKFRAGFTLNVHGEVAKKGDPVAIDLFYKGQIYRVLIPFAVRKQKTGF